MPQGEATIEQVEIRDSTFLNTFDRLSTKVGSLAASDTFLVDFFQSNFEKTLYYLEIRAFTPDPALEGSIGYYCRIGNKTLILPNNIPDGLFSETGTKMRITLAGSQRWEDSYPLLHLRYMVNDQCFELMELSDDHNSMWPV